MSQSELTASLEDGADMSCHIYTSMQGSSKELYCENLALLQAGLSSRGHRTGFSAYIETIPENMSEMSDID